MSRRRKKGPRHAADETGGTSRTTLTSRGRRLRPRSRFGAALLVAAVAAVGTWFLARHLLTRPVVLPAPRERVTRAVSREQFVGAEACGACHAAQVDAWRGSTHGRAGGAPSPARIIAPFDGTPIRFRDAVVTPRVTADGSYVFDVAPQGQPVVRLRVDGAIGGGHMAGGGTQGFVTRRPDGTWRFLPFDYSRHQRAWFCNTETRAGKGWQPITADLPLGACGDWPPVRVLGDIPRFANCQGCHASQLEVAFDTATGRYATHFSTLAIDCESCHGPARRHVDLAREGRLGAAADIGLAALGAADKDAASVVCYQCHAVKDQLRPGYLAGDSLERYYSLAFPLLGESPLFPDGRVRTFAYQETQRFSDCYLNGGMRCTDCHDPHSQGYRDVNGARLMGRLSDAQCTGCHPSKAVQPERHTRHAPGSPGSRCVGCHMPYLQPPQIGTVVRYGRSDHSIPVPRPAFDSAVGISTACAICHTSGSTASLEAQVEKWYGALKPVRPIVAAQLRTAPDASDFLGGEDEHVLARFAGLARFFERRIDDEGRGRSDSALDSLRRLAEHPDQDVRALALATLHWLGGDDRGTRRMLARALRRAGDRDAGLRDRWSLALGWAGDRLAREGRLDAAVIAYRRALEVTPDHPRLLLNLANAERDAGRIPEALAAYRRSLALEPAQSLTYVNMGIALAAAGDTSGAVAAWEAATRVSRVDPLPHFNLANVRLLRGDVPGAIESYRVALALDPALIAGYLNLARAYAVAGRLADARRTVRAALALDPTNGEARTLVDQLEPPPPRP